MLWKRQTLPYTIYFNSFFANIQDLCRNFINFVGSSFFYPQKIVFCVQFANKKP